MKVDSSLAGVKVDSSLAGVKVDSCSNKRDQSREHVSGGGRYNQGVGPSFPSCNIDIYSPSSSTYLPT